MRILINTASTFKGGGIQVAKSFIEECNHHPENEYHVVLGHNLVKSIREESFPGNFYFYKIGFRPATRIFSLKSATQFFRTLEKQVKPDVVFTTSGPAYWRPVAPHVVGFNLPHYIYPDSPFFSMLSPAKRIKWALKGVFIKYFMKRDADAYIVQTDDVRERLQKLISKEKVYTVSNTFSAHYRNPLSFENKLPVKQKKEFRLLTFTAWYQHKNIAIIPRVIDQLPEAVSEFIRFVLTLPVDVYEKNITEKYRRLIYNVGPVKMEEGPALYRECDAMFLPTLLECFSASYSEAMAMEKPILTSDMGFAKSICGDAALYFDPVSAVDIADKILQLVNSPELQKDLVEKGKKRMEYFGTAAKRAQEYLNICHDMANHNNKTKVTY